MFRLVNYISSLHAVELHVATILIPRSGDPRGCRISIPAGRQLDVARRCGVVLVAVAVGIGVSTAFRGPGFFGAVDKRFEGGQTHHHDGGDEFGHGQDI